MEYIVQMMEERDKARANARFWLGMSGENYDRATLAEARLDAARCRFRALALLSGTVIAGLFWVLFGGVLWKLLGRWMS
mgnify:FL=1